MFHFKVRSKLAMAVTVPIVVATVAVVGTPQFALGASRPVPVVLSFTAAKTSIPDAGGNVVLKARLKYASSCKIMVSPSLKGFPGSFSCSSDLVRRSVTLRANNSGNTITYTFGMIVKNSTGSTTATNIIVTEGAAPSPISFTPPPPGSPKTVVFAPEGVFVADDPLVVTVTNNSSTTQDITSAAISTVGDSADFILVRNNCAYVTAHASCSLAIQFQPSGAGIRTGAISVVDASWGTTGTTLQLQLRGTGVWAAATVSNNYIRNNVLVFPTSQVLLNPSPVQNVTVTNVGSVPLYISPYGISLTGGESTDFSVTMDTCGNQINVSDPLIVSIGHSCTFAVTFAPSGTGTRTSNVVVADNTLGAQTQLGLEGVGIEKRA
jgi:hypothetical protein